MVEHIEWVVVVKGGAACKVCRPKAAGPHREASMVAQVYLCAGACKPLWTGLGWLGLTED